MKKLLLVLPLFLVACSTTQTQEALSTAESAAWTGLNVLETVNTASGGVLTTDLANEALKATHNSGDAAVVDATLAAANKLIAVQAAAKAAGASPAAMQAVTTTTLSDPSVAKAVAASIPASALPASGSAVTPAPVPTAYHISKPVLRPVYGWRNPYNVELADNERSDR